MVWKIYKNRFDRFNDTKIVIMVQVSTLSFSFFLCQIRHVPNLLRISSIFIFSVQHYYKEKDFMKNFSVLLKEYVEVVFGAINVTLKFYPEVMDVLQDMPCWDTCGFVLYIGLIIYLWRDYIKSQHPFLYRVLTAIYNYCP